MKKIVILNKTEMNPFADSATAYNGGGYSQIRTEFRFGGENGIFSDTSCGDFGSRYDLRVGEKSARWGTMLDEWEKFSDFCDSDWELISALAELRIDVPQN